MSSRSDEYRQRAADAKNRAAQAKDKSIKGRLEQLAADWIALAEQAERIDSQKFLPRDDEKEEWLNCAIPSPAITLSHSRSTLR
jgi:hypothetical protein